MGVLCKIPDYKSINTEKFWCKNYLKVLKITNKLLHSNRSMQRQKHQPGHLSKEMGLIVVQIYESLYAHYQRVKLFITKYLLINLLHFSIVLNDFS